jgi:hypothetical protein
MFKLVSLCEIATIGFLFCNPTSLGTLGTRSLNRVSSAVESQMAPFTETFEKLNRVFSK